MNTLVLESAIQVALFEHELKGQISDGMWENTRPNNHWKIPCNATVLLAKEGDFIGRNFSCPKESYNFANAELVDIVGDRMIDIAKQAGAPSTYDTVELLKDLKAIKTAFKTDVRTATVIQIKGPYPGREPHSIVPTLTREQKLEQALRALVADAIKGNKHDPKVLEQAQNALRAEAE